MAKFPCLRMSSWRTDWQTNIDKGLEFWQALGLWQSCCSHTRWFFILTWTCQCRRGMSSVHGNIGSFDFHYKWWEHLPCMLNASFSFLACHHVGTVDSMSQDYVSGCSWWHPHLGLPHATYNLPNRIRSASGMKNYATAETLLGV